MKKVIMLCGPTATGKTDLGISLAKKFNAEIISVDSRQVYKGLDIGTGKLPKDPSGVERQDDFWIIDGVSIWMYDVVSPSVRFTVADYLKKANPIIEDILSREKNIILVGGTGLYFQVLLEGLSEHKIDLNKRKILEEMDLKDLQKKLVSLSPAIFESLNNSEKNNRRRLIRKIEIIEGSSNKNIPSLFQDFEILKIGLTAKRTVLNNFIDIRVDKRIDQGMIEESVNLHQNGLSISRMKELGLEYGLLSDLIEQKMNKKEFNQNLKIRIHQYAKRQMTWFTRVPSINWFDITVQNWQHKVDKLVSDWYNKQA